MGVEAKGGVIHGLMGSSASPESRNGSNGSNTIKLSSKRASAFLIMCCGKRWW
jgi:hypothetical protein